MISSKYYIDGAIRRINEKSITDVSCRRRMMRSLDRLFVMSNHEGLTSEEDCDAVYMESLLFSGVWLSLGQNLL
jgi:hypothetical protein